MSPRTMTSGNEAYAALTDALTNARDSAELFKTANDGDFVAAARTLAPDDLKALRELYKARKTDLDGKVKLEEYDGQIIRIVGVSFWHTDKRFGNPNASGDGVTLTYHPERDPHVTRRSLTTSSVVYRFIRQNTRDGAEMPSEDKPMRTLVELVPVRDAERAAAGQRQWSFQRLPLPGANDGSEDSPF